MKQIILVLCFATVIMGEWIEDTNIELPEEITMCKLNDPERDECLKDAIQRGIPIVRNGLESIQLPPIDPYSIENAHFEYTVPSVLLGSFSIKQTKCYGISRAQIKNVRSEFTDNEMNVEIDVSIPRLFLEGFYKGLNRYNNFRLSSKGFFNLTLTGIENKLKIAGKMEERNGEKYMKITKFDMTPEVKSMKIYFEGLFPDPELNNIAIILVNQFSDVMYREMLPETKRYWEPLLIDIANGFINRLPFRKFWSNDE